MLVDLEDGKCQECGGQLDIEEVDDCSMLVVCTECGEDLQLEPDAFGDGCMKYYVRMQAIQEGLDPDDIFR